MSRIRKNFAFRIAACAVAFTSLSDCAVYEVNGNIDVLNKSIKGTGFGTPSGTSPAAGATAPGDVLPDRVRNAERSVSFRRRVSGYGRQRDAVPLVGVVRHFLFRECSSLSVDSSARQAPGFHSRMPVPLTRGSRVPSHCQ